MRQVAQHQTHCARKAHVGRNTKRGEAGPQAMTRGRQAPFTRCNQRPGLGVQAWPRMQDTAWFRIAFDGLVKAMPPQGLTSRM